MCRTIAQTILCLSLLLLGACSKATKNQAALQPTLSPPVVSSSKVPTPVPTITAVATGHPATLTPTLSPMVASSTKVPTPVASTTTVDLVKLHESELFEALQFFPQVANYVQFINWAHIKKIEGFESVTSTSDRDEWRKFFLTAFQKDAVDSAYGITRLAEHAQVWGWDTADLEWEARLIMSSPPSYILKFREDFSFAPIISRFEERGFEKRIYQGIPIYTHKLDINLEWLRATEFSILNTAVIEDAHMLVMSINPDFVMTMIDAYQDRSDSLADKPDVQAVVSRLDDPIAAFVSGDPCSVFSSEALLARQRFDTRINLDQLQAQLNNRPQLRNYDALGIGYFMKISQPVGMIVMQFSNVEEANEDLQARQQLAQTGLVRDKEARTYSEVFFTLEQDAKVDGRQIIILVKPVDNNPSRFFMMIDRMDMTFATCP
jgi:hypothetical protein